MVIPSLVAMVDYDQWSVVSFVMRKPFCVLIYGKTVYIFSYANVLQLFNFLLLNFLKPFSFSFGIFIVFFLIFTKRGKLNYNNFLLNKKFLKRISRASLKSSIEIND